MIVQRAKISLIGLIILSIAGCSRPNPTPELIDPIYADLNQRSAVAKAAGDSAKAELKQLREDIKNLPARDPSRRKTTEDISKKELQIMVADQESLYFEIRANQRRDYARAEYLKAYDKGESWPNPADFEAYKAERRLRDAPREWSSKIEKTNRYNRKTADEMRKELDEKIKGGEKKGGSKAE